MTRPLKIATMAVPLSGNKGSASMLLGLIDGFADAGLRAHFHVFSYYPERDAEIAKQFSNVTVHPGHPKHLAFGLLPAIAWRALTFDSAPLPWREHVDAIRHCDAALMIGGTTFSDTMAYKVPWNVLAAIPGYCFDRPTFFLSQTLGPMNKAPNRISARWTLGRAAQVHGRGKSSAEWSRQLGIESTIDMPDLSFMMHVPAFDEVADRLIIVGRLRERITAFGRLPIGVAPNAIVYQKARKAGIDYIAFIAEVIALVESMDLLPVLIPHSYRSDTTSLHNNDREICRRVLNRLPAASTCFHLDGDLDSRDLRAVISRLHLLVASRFHSMVSALATAVPPITFGWGSHKYSEVLSDFGLEDLYTPYNRLSVNSVRNSLERCLRDRENLSTRIKSALPDVTRRAARVPQLVAEAVAPR